MVTVYSITLNILYPNMMSDNLMGQIQMNHPVAVCNFLTRFPGGPGAEDNPCEAVRAHEVHSRARQGEVLRHDEGAQRGQRQGNNISM